MTLQSRRSLVCRLLEVGGRRATFATLPALPGPRFIGCNSASADRTCGFPTVAEALYGSLCNGFKWIWHDLRSSVVCQFEAFSALTSLCLLCIAILSSVHFDAIPHLCPGDPLGPCLRTEEADAEDHEADRNAAPGNGDPEFKGSRFRF